MIASACICLLRWTGHGWPFLLGAGGTKSKHGIVQGKGVSELHPGLSEARRSARGKPCGHSVSKIASPAQIYDSLSQFSWLCLPFVLVYLVLENQRPCLLDGADFNADKHAAAEGCLAAKAVFSYSPRDATLNQTGVLHEYNAPMHAIHEELQGFKWNAEPAYPCCRECNCMCVFLERHIYMHIFLFV